MISVHRVRMLFFMILVFVVLARVPMAPAQSTGPLPLYVGPGLVLLYQDGSKIYRMVGKPGGSLDDWSSPAEVLTSGNDMRGLGAATLHNEIWAAWISGRDIKVAKLPGSAASAVVVASEPGTDPISGPALACDGEALVLAWGVKNLLKVSSSSDGTTWSTKPSRHSASGQVAMPWATRHGDRVFVGLPVHRPNDRDELRILRIYADGTDNEVSWEFAGPSTGAAYDARFGTSLASDSSAFAVAWIVDYRDSAAAGGGFSADRLAISDPSDGHHLSWSGGFSPRVRSGPYLPSADLFDLADPEILFHGETGFWIFDSSKSRIYCRYTADFESRGVYHVIVDNAPTDIRKLAATEVWFGPSLDRPINMGDLRLRGGKP